MIPTRIKSIIPKFLSYPLGAKAISDALAGVPQAGLLTIQFRFWNDWRRRGMNKPYSWIPAWGKPVPVLCVSYSNISPTTFSSNDMIARGYYSPKWEISVEAVPRIIKHQIQTKLIAEALPKMRQWLIANAGATGREGGHHLTFFYDDLSNELTSKETSSVAWYTERS